jgi:hypothetical protein
VFVSKLREVECVSSGPTSLAKNIATKHGTGTGTGILKHHCYSPELIAIFIQVKNEWSYTSVPTICLHGVDGCCFIHTLLIKYYTSLDSAVFIVTSLRQDHRKIEVRFLAEAR